MPTTYAHDLFGKRIYRRLPAGIKTVIRENGELYRIGLHGPDILFYHLFDNKVNQLGVQMHRKPARDFFEKGMETVRKSKDSALLAYLMGFGCHYLLDTVCHPFINEMDEKGVISHTLLEKEFDRRLMIQTKRNPYFYYPSDCIVPRREYAGVIHRAIPQIPSGKIYVSLKMMKFVTNAMVYDDGGKKRFVLGILTRLTGKKRSEAVMDHFMTREPAAKSECLMDSLYSLYRKASEEAPAYLEELFALSQKPGKLSERWDLTYSG